MKKLLLASMAFVASLTLAACQSSNSQQESSTTVSNETTTYAGVEIPKNPQRVVLAGFSYTGDFLKLGVTPVGVTSYDKENPVFKELLKDVPVVASDDPEAIAALKPDVIITFSTDQNIDKLKAIAPTIAVEYNKYDYLQQFIEIGKILNKEDEAKTWVENWKKETAQVGEQIKQKIGADKTFTLLGIEDKQYYLFGNNWGRGGEVLFQALGLTPQAKVKADIFPTGWKEINQEAIPEYAGDYIVLIRKNQEIGKSLVESDLWKNLPAVKDKHVLDVDANLFYYNDPMSLEQELAVLKEHLLAQ